MKVRSICFGQCDPNRPPQPDLQQLPIEKQQLGTRLVLRAGRDIPRHGQMTQKGLDLIPPHLAGMALAMKEDVTSLPSRRKPATGRRYSWSARLWDSLAQRSYCVSNETIALCGYELHEPYCAQFGCATRSKILTIDTPMIWKLSESGTTCTMP